ncbi:putative tRNA-splicing endonuclease subunit sen54 [Pseudocercospora fuligena]|uniref:Putative tRNA-splicing endonuclease subunit sen54 n=1 Tax=Pseudocercospora fuligena TaxID=685502 RepID=A0A8H6RAH0_9PEZI|nr:putative tRNA-splicing endonuclease subunit sen54 [Pseudocercospora fuligena]
MADADEDVIPRGGTGGEDVDLSDETQDFRFLSSISREDATIPKRGEKDFEPHATALQSNTLAASRQAMHNALSYQRIHNPNGYTYAVYHPESNMAYSQNPKGVLFSKMGQVFSAADDPLGNDEARGQRLWFLPEEIIYLIERGTVDVRWPSTEDVEELGLPMSLQGAYAMFLGDEASHNGALTLERYSVYASLKRLGYIVMRAPSWDSPGLPLTDEHYPKTATTRRTWQAGLFTATSIWKLFFGKDSWQDQKCHETGPIIAPGLYRDYISIYQRLALINFYDPHDRKAPAEPELPNPDPDFRITYHVWKPGSSNFKKSAPGPPDFRIAVVNARETSVPTLEQLSSLIDTIPFSPPRPDANFYAKLKNGYKNVILAVVDQGMTSYLRIADAAFGCEKIYERRARGGAKRGGRGGRGGGRGGRGRGRG